MEIAASLSTSLTQLLDASEGPIYAVDAGRQLVYCNTALVAWLGLARERIVGRSVEYHSEPASERGPRGTTTAPLTDLCPPPQAFGGIATTGTVGCVGRDGRLVHRRAEFVPLGTAEQGSGILALLAAEDLSPQELARSSDEPTADELHRAIRTFRRQQATEYALESLLGESDAIRKVRAQVVAAAASQAHVLVRGHRGMGREHIGRAIHYQARDAAGKLIPIDCPVATEESLRRAAELLRGPRDPKRRHTLLLLNLQQLPAPLQTQLAALVSGGTLSARIVSTLDEAAPDLQTMDEEFRQVDPQLLNLLSTMTIDAPALSQRLVDLPILAQYFLEAANRDNAKQIGSLRPEVLDQLALYRWPRGLDELRGVIEAAHAAANTHEITVGDLPTLLQHAACAAATPRRAPEKINLSEFMESIERELISRALAQAGGNKSAAAELLGMPRPRLYRRLVQLGMVAAPASAARGAAVMSRAEWIVCERTSRWAAALRLALTQDDPAPRLRELRHLSELDSEVAARPGAIVAIEVHRGNFAAVLHWLSRPRGRQQLTKCTALLDRSLVSDCEAVVGPLLEAGAVAIAPSPRRLDDLLALERFQTQIAGISGSRESLLDQLRASLPWQGT